MQENTNKAIVVNTLILYVRLILTSVFELITTRYVLKVLGVEDFGLFTVLGSIISLIAVVNTVMLSTSNRYISVAIGKNDTNEINKIFNVNLLIYIGIAIVTLLFAFLIGDWYIFRHVNYSGDINIAVKVFHIAILGSVVSFISVPYNGLLMAKEKFSVYCITNVGQHLLKLLAVIALGYYAGNRLLLYALIVAFTTSLPTFIYWWYCRKKYNSLTKFRLIKDRQCYHEILGFSLWVAYGAVANIGKSQGAALLVNAFFSTIMNTALGIANTVNTLIMTFAHNVTKPLAPQITKNYAVGNMKRCNRLMVLTSKFSFMTMLLISVPFLIETEYILQLWLGYVPDYAVIFTRLIVVDALLGSFNAGVGEIIFASGKIKLYQIVVNTIWLLSIVAAYFVLKSGAPAYFLIYTYIVFTLIVLVVRQWVLHRTLNFNNWILIKGAFIPSLVLLLLFSPVFYVHIEIHSLVKILISTIYLLVLIYLVGLNKNERKYIMEFVSRKLIHCNK